MNKASGKLLAFMLLILCSSLHLSAQEEYHIPPEADAPEDFIPAGWDTLQISHYTNHDEEVYITAMALKRANEDELAGDTARLLLVVEFVPPIGAYKLTGFSDQALLCRECGGIFGDPFHHIAINDEQLLEIAHYGGSGWRWAFLHKFKWMDGAWRLVYDEQVNYHAGDQENTYEVTLKQGEEAGLTPLESFSPEY